MLSELDVELQLVQFFVTLSKVCSLQKSEVIIVGI